MINVKNLPGNGQLTLSRGGGERTEKIGGQGFKKREKKNHGRSTILINLRELGEGGRQGVPGLESKGHDDI